MAPAAVSLRLAQLEDEASRLATRLAEIAQERAAAADAALCQDDLTAALGLFAPVWDALYPAERARIIELLVERVEVDGEAGTLAVTFHPTGIKALAAGGRGVRVEVRVDWGREAGKPRQDNPLNDLAPPRSRAERRLWYVAVGREIEARVASGEFASYADAARRCGVSRPQISQLLR